MAERSIESYLTPKQQREMAIFRENIKKDIDRANLRKEDQNRYYSDAVEYQAALKFMNNFSSRERYLKKTLNGLKEKYKKEPTKSEQDKIMLDIQKRNNQLSELRSVNTRARNTTSRLADAVRRQDAVLQAAYERQQEKKKVVRKTQG